MQLGRRSTDDRRAQRQASDLTARARIRDAAIDCFAELGFDTSFRAIADRAGVSPGLITHHFGSKATLREECDAEVLRRYSDVKRATVAEPAAAMLRNLGTPGMPAVLLVYVLRAVAAGGPGARLFLDHLSGEMRPVMAEAVAAGLVRPSRNEEARLRYLTYQSLGALLVAFLTGPHDSPEAFVTALSEGSHELMLPMLELFTEGFIADASLLDTYLEHSGSTTPEPVIPAATLHTGRE